MANLFNFEIHTPYRLFLSDQVEAFILTLSDGEIAVYANHSAFIAPVRTGILKIKTKDGSWKYAFVTDGILEVKEHKNVLLVDTAEWPEEIDYDRALAEKQRAQESLESGMFKFETESAQASLRRAETRILVYHRAHKPQDKQEIIV
jgi:F-type H+-transporting ATPase subunit epsilon